MENVTLPSFREQQDLLAKIQYLEIKLEQYEESRSFGHDEVVRLTKKNEMLEEENEQLKRENEKLKAEAEEELLGLLDGLRIGGQETMEDVEVEALERQVRGLEAARAQLECDANYWYRRCGWTESQWSGAAREVEMLTMEVAACQAQIAARDTALTGMRGDASKKQALINAMNWEGERLAAKEKRMEVDLEMLVVKNKALEEELKKIEEEKKAVVPVELKTVVLCSVEVVPVEVVAVEVVSVAVATDAVELVGVELSAHDIAPAVVVEEKKKEEQKEEEKKVEEKVEEKEEKKQEKEQKEEEPPVVQKNKKRGREEVEEEEEDQEGEDLGRNPKNTRR